MLFDPEGRKLGERSLESRVLSLHFVGDDLMAGEDRGCLTRLAPDSTPRAPSTSRAKAIWLENEAARSQKKG